MARRTQAEIYFGIFVTGIFMPVLQLCDSSITYAMNQTANIMITDKTE